MMEINRRVSRLTITLKAAARTAALACFLLLPTPAMAYEFEHYAWTYYVALHVGYTEREAWQIASGTMAVDYDPNTSPMGAHPQIDLAIAALGIANPGQRQIWRRFHAFTSVYDSDSVSATEYSEMLFKLAVEQQNPGPWLHFTMDSFAHGGWTDVYGHGPGGHLTDYIATDLKKAEAMTDNTIENLIRFKNGICAKNSKMELCYRVKHPSREARSRLSTVLTYMAREQPNDSCGTFGGPAIVDSHNRVIEQNCEIDNVAALLDDLKLYLSDKNVTADVYQGLSKEDYLASLTSSFSEEELNMALRISRFTQTAVKETLKADMALRSTFDRLYEIENIYRAHANLAPLTQGEILHKKVKVTQHIDNKAQDFIRNSMPWSVEADGVYFRQTSDSEFFDSIKKDLLFLRYTQGASDQPLGPYLSVIRQAVLADKKAGLLSYVRKDLDDRPFFMSEISKTQFQHLPERWIKYRYEPVGRFLYGGAPVELENRVFTSKIREIEPTYRRVAGTGPDAVYQVSLSIPVNLTGSRPLYSARTALAGKQGENTNPIELMRQLPVVVTSAAPGRAQPGYRDTEGGIVYLWDDGEYQPKLDQTSAGTERAGIPIPYLAQDGKSIQLSVFRSARDISSGTLQWKVELFAYGFSKHFAVYNLAMANETEEAAIEHTASTPQHCPPYSLSYGEKPLNEQDRGLGFCRYTSTDKNSAGKPLYYLSEEGHRKEELRGEVTLNLSIQFHENGALKRINPMSRQGRGSQQLNGLAVSYYPNGTLGYHSFFRANKAEGRTSTYFSDGLPKETVHYQAGEKHGFDYRYGGDIHSYRYNEADRQLNNVFHWQHDTAVSSRSSRERCDIVTDTTWRECECGNASTCISYPFSDPTQYRANMQKNVSDIQRELMELNEQLLTAWQKKDAGYETEYQALHDQKWKLIEALYSASHIEGLPNNSIPFTAADFD